MMKKMNAVAVLMFAVLTWGAGPLVADPKKMEGNEIFPKAAKDFEFWKLKSISKNQNIMVPMIELRVQNWGSQTVIAQSKHQFGSDAKTSSASARADVTVALDPATAKKLATQIHADLEKRLKAEGWNVLSLEDFKDSKAYKKITFEEDGELGKGLKSEKKTGRMLGVGVGDTLGQGYFIATAEGTRFIKPKLGVMYNAVKGIAKDANAVVLTPAYTINLMNFDKNKEESASKQRVSAAVEVTPVVGLLEAKIEFTTPNGGMASILAPVNQAWGSEFVGDVTLASETSPKLANTLGAVSGALGLGASGKSSGDYVLAPESALLEQEVMRIALGVNDVVARATGYYAPQAKK